MRRLIVLIMLVAFIAGCSKAPSTVQPAPSRSEEPVAAPVWPAPGPGPEPAPAPEPTPAPAPPPPEPPRTVAAGQLGLSDMREAWVEAGIKEAQVTESTVDVRFHLPPMTTREQVMAALVIDAPAQPRLFFSSRPEEMEVLLRFAPGKAGDVITAKLVGLADLGFRITRFPSPQVVAELKRQGHDWEPLSTIPVLPRQPLTFRFRMLGGADPDAARAVIIRTLKGNPKIEQPEPDTLVVTVPEPPPLLYFDFREVRGKHGIVEVGGATVYVGEPPLLTLLDPSTGKEEPIMEAPADLLRGSLSPDGRWLMLSGMAPASPWEDSVFIADLQAKQIRLTSLEDEAWRSSPVLWLPDRLVLPVYGEVQAWDLKQGKAETRPTNAWWWESISPDSRYIIGFDVDFGRENKEWMAPATIYIHDVQTGTERVLTDAVQYRVSHKGGYAQIRTIWQPDGRHVVISEWHWKDAGSMRELQERFVLVDIASGKTEPYTGPAPGPQTWEEWLPGPGGWQVRTTYGGWGEVVLKAPDGAEQNHGNALIVGWTSEGRLLMVRWTAEERRQRYSE